MSTTAPVSGTLRDILDAFTRGLCTTHDIRSTTGLDRELVEIALDQLTVLGLVTRDSTNSGCPGGGCNSCNTPIDYRCATPGDARHRGLVTLRLIRRPD